MADGIAPVATSQGSVYGGGNVGLLKKRPKGSSGSSEQGDPPSMKRGGKVRKGGMIRMHKGEVVIPAGKAKRMKMRGMRSRGGKRR